MNTDALARSYAEIVKFDKHDDGTMTVYGKATDDSLDIDMQICDAAWLDRAMPEWFKSGGNIREQHSNIAAGVAQEYERKDDGHYISALVVDPVSVKKVEARVLKGFSIGIKAPRVVRDQKAANGRIIDGQIVEVSLVDRPANPNAKLVLAKTADGGELEQVEELTEQVEVVDGVSEAQEDISEALEEVAGAEGIEKRDVSTEERERLADRGAAMPDGSYPIANEADLKNAIQAYGRAKDPAAVKRHIIRRARALGAVDQLPEDWNVKKNAQIVEDFIAKFDKPAFEAARNAIARLIEVEANEVAQGHDERLSIAHLLEALNHLTAWYEGEAHEGEVGGVEVAEDHEHEEVEIELAAAPEEADTEEKCDKCNEPMKMCKCNKEAGAEKSADADETEADAEVEAAPEVSDPVEAEPEVVEEIVAKAVSAATESVRAEVAALIAAKEAAEQKAAGLETQLSDALNKAAGGGPRRTGRTSPDSLNDNLVKAAMYRAKAQAATDPVLAKGYRALADEFAGVQSND